MPPQLIQPREKYMLPHVVDRAAVLEPPSSSPSDKPRSRHARPVAYSRMRLLLLLALAGTSPDTLRAPGLSRPVEILRDAHGISHIYAQNEHDLFFAQGYVGRVDRLFQLEIWRRQATGTVAELLGPRELERDVGARLFKFRGNMETELARYHPHGGAIVRAFVDGINAYVALTERDPTKLPLEFRLLGTKPGRWTPDVVVSRYGGLLGNITEELTLTRAVAAVGPDVVKRIENFHPGDPDLTIDPAIDHRCCRRRYWHSIKRSARRSAFNRATWCSARGTTEGI